MQSPAPARHARASAPRRGRASGFPSPRWRSPGLALGALAVAVGFLVAQGAAAAHLLLVSHVRCTEHGELTHVGDGAGAHRPGATRAVAHVPGRAHALHAARPPSGTRAPRAAAAPARASGGPAATRSASLALRVAPTPADTGHRGHDGEHTHCGVRVVPAVASDAVSPSPWLGRLAVEGGGPASPAARHARHRPIPLLRAAPKASPPAA